jgi:predicted  nucleic acid-binding Zn-ribbon protein
MGVTPSRLSDDMSNTQESIAKDLEARQAEIQDSIQNAVRYGGESMKLRQELKVVQDQLQIARNEVATIQSAGRQAAARVTGKVGDELGVAAIDRIVGGATQFAELLAAVQVPDFASHASVSSAMQNVAAARQRVADAEAAQVTAAVEVDNLAGKIAVKRERQDELTRQSLADEVGQGSHAERYSISEDLATLQAMHKNAQESANALTQPVNDARIALSAVTAQAAKIEHRIAAEFLAAHARQLEAAYISCLRACQAEGAKAGVGIGALVEKGIDLRSWVGSGLIPKPFGQV